MEETLVDIAKRAQTKQVPVNLIGSVILRSVLANRKRNAREYRTGFADYFSKLEMNGIRQNLSTMSRFTADSTGIVPIPEELSDVLESTSEVYQINFVCDALKYLRLQNKSWEEISGLLGEVALSSMSSANTGLKERETKSAYISFLRGLTRRIAKDYGIYLASPPKDKE